MDMEMWCMQMVEYYPAIKNERNNTMCTSTDGPRDYQTQ